WDKSQPKQQPGSLLIELGKPLGRQQSDPIGFQLDAATASTYIRLQIVSRHIDSQNEAFLSLNGRSFLPIPAPIEVDALGYGMSTVIVGKENLIAGANQLVFGYNPQSFDRNRGFVIYDIRY